MPLTNEKLKELYEAVAATSRPEFVMVNFRRWFRIPFTKLVLGRLAGRLMLLRWVDDDTIAFL